MIYRIELMDDGQTAFFVPQDAPECPVGDDREDWLVEHAVARCQNSEVVTMSDNACCTVADWTSNEELCLIAHLLVTCELLSGR